MDERAGEKGDKNIILDISTDRGLQIILRQVSVWWIEDFQEFSIIVMVLLP